MTQRRSLRVLVVDDTIFYRKIVGDILTELPYVEVIGTAGNGKIALERARTLKPDLITLDIEMPEINGLQVLSRLQEDDLRPDVIMVSTLTREGADITMKAMELGAFDFIAKPQSGSMKENKECLRKSLAPMISALRRRREIQEILGGRSRTTPRPFPRKAAAAPRRKRHLEGAPYLGRSGIVAIGISTGGPKALAEVIPALPKGIGVPVLVVQHMPPIFTRSLAESLDRKSALVVREAVDGDRLTPDTVFIAPGGRHMKIVQLADGATKVIRVTEDPPENSCRPSADYLFRSVAEHFVGRATGVIMTGMGADGNRGLEQMKHAGAWIIAQDEKTCVVYGMPKRPVETGIADVVAPLNRIPDEILKTLKKSGSGPDLTGKRRLRYGAGISTGTESP